MPDNLSITRFLLQMVRKRKQLLLITAIWTIQTQTSLLHKKMLIIKPAPIDQCAASIPLSVGCETSPETGGESHCSVLKCSISRPKRHSVFCIGFKDCQIVPWVFLLKKASSHQKRSRHVSKAYVDYVSKVYVDYTDCSY